VLSGSTNVTSGTLGLAGAGKLASGILTLWNADSNLDLGGTSQNVAALRLTSGMIQNGSLTAAAYNLESGTISAVLSGGAGLLKTTSGKVTLSGSNTLSAQTDVLAGSLMLSGAGKLSSGTLTVSGSASTLFLGATNQTVGLVNLIGGATISGTTGSLAAGSFAVQSGTITAILAGTAGLSKTTADTVLLSGANTYSGPTFVKCGDPQPRPHQMSSPPPRA
jgi:autotransporter-associated beta strand protein